MRRRRCGPEVERRRHGRQDCTSARPTSTLLIAQAKRSYASQTPPKTFPKPGTADYETIKGQAVPLLVQQAEREEKAASMGITISDADVQKRLDQVKKQYFGGSETKYQAQLKKQDLTDAQVAEGHSPAADLGGDRSPR